MHYRRLGVVEGSLLVDRAQLLLSTRLLDEARANAEAAVRTFAQGERGNHLPEAQLLVASVALVQGDTATAVAAGEQARAAFARLRRSEWLVLARFACARAVLGAGPPVNPGRLPRPARQLQPRPLSPHPL